MTDLIKHTALNATAQMTGIDFSDKVIDFNLFDNELVIETVGKQVEYDRVEFEGYCRHYAKQNDLYSFFYQETESEEGEPYTYEVFMFSEFFEQVDRDFVQDFYDSNKKL